MEKPRRSLKIFYYLFVPESQVGGAQQENTCLQSSLNLWGASGYQWQDAVIAAHGRPAPRPLLLPHLYFLLPWEASFPGLLSWLTLKQIAQDLWCFWLLTCKGLMIVTRFIDLLWKIRAHVRCRVGHMGFLLLSLPSMGYLCDYCCKIHMPHAPITVASVAPDCMGQKNHPGCFL